MRINLLRQRVLSNPYIPQVPTPKQAAFLVLSENEAMYGGQVGGGKSSALLMAALMYVDTPGYAALLLRRTYADLSLPEALMSRAHEWLQGTDARWHDQDKTWSFPSGATITFGYLATENDKYRYQSAAFQFCTAAGTRILTGAGSDVRVEDLRVGDYVQTLNGFQRVTRVSPGRLAPCVRIVIKDGSDIEQSQVHSTNHRILTPWGWLSYDDIVGASHPYVILESTQSHSLHRLSSQLPQKSQSRAQTSLYPFGYQPLPPEPSQLHEEKRDCAAVVACSIDEETFCAGLCDSHQVSLTPGTLFVPVVRRSPLPRSDRVECLEAPCEYVRARNGIQSANSLADYLSLSHLCDEHPLRELVCGQYDPALSGGVAGQSNSSRNTDSKPLPLDARYQSIWYDHPYTTERQHSVGFFDVVSSWITPVGERVVFDITVESESHYITQIGLVQANCGYDELTQFTETQYTYLFSRLRRLAGLDVPLRMRAASNPGGIGHAWVYNRFPIGRPAEAGQTKRAFVPAGLDDNPYLDRASYVMAMQELDDITKAQLLGGQWVTDPALKPFKADWWRGQNRWHVNPQESIARFISWDTALKDKEGSDYTAVIVAELLADYRLAVRKVHKSKLEFPALAAAIETEAEHFATDDKLRAVVIEDKGSGTSALQTLRQTAPAWLAGLLQEFLPTSDKVQRARQASVWCDRDCVLLPHPGDNAPWLHDFEKQLAEFPDVLHDDDIDAFSQLILYVEHYLAAGWHARNNPQ